jgi:SSS family solute:Na+ symporter
MTSQTHAAIAIGLVIYAGLMLAVSLFWMRRVKQPADYLVGGRSLPFWVLTGNITAGCIGTGVIVGASGLAYQHGWAGSAYPIGLGLGTALAGLIFAVMRRYKFMTLSEEISSYYGANRAVVEFSNISLFLSQLCWLTVQIIGGASVLAAVTTMPRDLCVVAAGCITASIAIPGGFKSVVYTDFLQALILLAGFGVVTYSALHESGGLDGLRAAVPPAYFSFLGVKSYGGWKVAGLIAALTLSVLADPGRRMSMYGAQSEPGARWSMFCAGFIVICFSAVIGIAGMYAFRRNPHLQVPDSALLWLVMNVLPAWLAAFVVVSVTSGIISCANGNAMAVSTFFVRHIFPLATRGRYPKRPLLAARLSLAGAFALCTFVAARTGTIVGFVIKFLPVTMSGLAIIIVLGRFWRRATWQGALAAQIITPLVSLTAVIFFPKAAWNNAVILAVPGVVAHVLVSWLTPPPARSFDQVAEALNRERQSIEGRPPPETNPLTPLDRTVI